MVTEQLILVYAKQLVSGMPEPVWRANMLTLINECDKEHREDYEREIAKYNETQRRAAESPSGHSNETLLRRTSKRKVFKGASETHPPKKKGKI